MSEAIPYVAVHKVMVCPSADIPKDERTWVPDITYRAQVHLYRFVSPMQAGLPPISADPQVALKRAFNGLRRTRFHD
ncbi:MAG: hypothetical protein JOY55_17670, partial [Mycobacterium sp.]|nr:hypothetical protein [Mycobacterium sp.]